MKNLILTLIVATNFITIFSMEHDSHASSSSSTSSASANSLRCCRGCKRKEKYLGILEGEVLPSLTNFYEVPPEALPEVLETARRSGKDGHPSLTKSTTQSYMTLVSKMKESNKDLYDHRKREIFYSRWKNALFGVGTIVIGLANGGYLIYNVSTSDDKPKDRAAEAITGGAAALTLVAAGARMIWHAWRNPEGEDLKFNKRINRAHTDVTEKLLKNLATVLETQQQILTSPSMHPSIFPHSSTGVSSPDLSRAEQGQRASIMIGNQKIPILLLNADSISPTSSSRSDSSSDTTSSSDSSNLSSTTSSSLSLPPALIAAAAAATASSQSSSSSGSRGDEDSSF